MALIPGVADCLTYGFVGSLSCGGSGRIMGLTKEASSSYRRRYWPKLVSRWDKVIASIHLTQMNERVQIFTNITALRGST